MGKREEVKKPRLSRANSFKHGHRCGADGKPSTEYVIWSGLLKRCLNPNCNIYPYYGGRGITVDSSWLDFRVFLAEVGPRPSPEHSLDRIDNNEGYYKSNVRWSTRTEQSKNRRNNIFVEGVILKDWCVSRGYRYKTVWRWFALEGKPLDFIIERGDLLWAKEK